MRELERNVIFCKAGGNAGRNSYSYKISLPADAIEALGVTPDNRSVLMRIQDGKVVLEKN